MGIGASNKTEISQNIQQDLDNGIDIEDIVPSIEALVPYLAANTYNPVINIITSSISEKPTSSTFNVTISGEFLDSLTNVSIEAANNTGISVNITSISFSTLVLQITTNADAQQYILSFLKGSNLVSTLNFDALNITLIVPSLSGTGQSLWQQPNPVPANNGATLSDGRFQAEQNTGEGWNDHAFYGGFTGSFTKIVHEFTTRNSTNAYCYIRFNNTTNPSTGGGPRIYVSNATTLFAHNNSGEQIYRGSVSENDRITVEFTSTTMEVFVNGNSIVQDTGSYSIALQGSFVNFTAFRFSILEDIETKLI